MLSIFYGCSSTSVESTPANPGIEMTISGLYPSRSSESYALWLEFPVQSTSQKGQPVLHGDFVEKLVSTFRISSDGTVVGFDTTGLLSRLGESLKLATYAILSVEKSDSIGSDPRASFLAGDITGTESTGTVTLKTTNLDALNYGFTDMTASITLANAPGKPTDDLELYIMKATSQTQTSAGINNLPTLPEPWHYALWAVDSATKSLPPFNIYYGTFTNPAGFGTEPPDSQPEDNHYNYPGGRYPADSTQPVYNLRSGRTTVMMTIEPITEGSRPSVPFGAIIGKVTIPTATQAFSPIDLQNVASEFPTMNLIIHR
ncbi:MAG: hypothetical protein Q8916_02125 [Bacteroidota bacterium]|nr:hypothetical protein [Bacteroidota bacterium]MDP4229185.1 hypothetical protein [Bacteroidota bacterium]MDP4235503.1 hypothetical protein [Bacteroidota bacterium]